MASRPHTLVPKRLSGVYLLNERKGILVRTNHRRRPGGKVAENSDIADDVIQAA